jgi:CheY-like chemotaxis protein
MLGIGEKHELPTILLIDDDLVSREVIATLLTLHGHMVHTADNGEAALKMLTAGTVAPEMILMDAQLPGLNGIGLLEQLRKSSEAPVCIISGSAAPEDLTAAADGFLLKPFSPEDLQRMLAGYDSKLDLPASAIKEEPVVSPETLSQFRQLMAETTVREIYTALVTDLKKRESALEMAIASGNKDEVRRIGHAIKGGSGMAGALQVAHLGAFFESKSDQLDNCAAAMQELYTATRKLERMLEKEFPA